MSHLYFLFSIVIFAGSANLYLWLKHRQLLKKYVKKSLGFSLLLTPIMCVLDWPATRWGAWSFSSEHVLNYKIFGAELEVYILTFFIASALFNATVIYSRQEDSKRQ